MRRSQARRDRGDPQRGGRGVAPPPARRGAPQPAIEPASSRSVSAEPFLERVQYPCKPAELLGGDALEVERVHENVPAAVDVADEVLHGDLDAVEKDLAQVAAAEHRETAHLDTGRVDRRDEDRDAAMSRLVGVRANGEVDPVGDPRARRPDLVAVDDPAISPEHGTRRERCEVAPRPGLREALAERELAARNRAEQPLSERRRSEALEGAADRLVGEEVERERQPVVAEDVLGERGIDMRQAAAAHLLRPGHADPSRVAQRARDLARVSVGEHPLTSPLRVGRQGRTQARREGRRLLAQPELLLCQSQIHARRS